MSATERASQPVELNPGAIRQRINVTYVHDAHSLAHRTASAPGDGRVLLCTAKATGWGAQNHGFCS